MINTKGSYKIIALILFVVFFFALIEVLFRGTTRAQLKPKVSDKYLTVDAVKMISVGGGAAGRHTTLYAYSMKVKHNELEFSVPSNLFAAKGDKVCLVSYNDRYYVVDKIGRCDSAR